MRESARIPTSQRLGDGEVGVGAIIATVLSPSTFQHILPNPIIRYLFWESMLVFGLQDVTKCASLAAVIFFFLDHDFALWLIGGECWPGLEADPYNARIRNPKPGTSKPLYPEAHPHGVGWKEPLASRNEA